MIDIKKYRTEWKYNLNNQQLSLLKSRISSLLVLDEHSKKDKYIVHTLYFDNYKNIITRMNDLGNNKRFKWRIRYYNDDINYIVLEKKEKLNNRSHKKVCPITLKEYEDILSFNMNLLYETDKLLIKELFRDIMLYNFVPRIIIDYERIAYTEKVTNVRVTFDLKISVSSDIDNFLNGSYHKYPINPGNYNVLEVKFDDILPSYIRKVIESYGFNQTSYSKCYYGMKMINSYYL